MPIAKVALITNNRCCAGIVYPFLSNDLIKEVVASFSGLVLRAQATREHFIVARTTRVSPLQRAWSTTIAALSNLFLIMAGSANY